MNTIEQAREVSARLRGHSCDPYDKNPMIEAADTIDALIAENAALLAANRDSVDWFENLKVDYDAQKAELAALKSQEPVGHLTLDGDFIQNQRWVMQFGIVPRGKSLYLAAGAQEHVACGYDETTGICTQNPCCHTAAGAQPVQQDTIAGALFDFMGWLTTRKERLVLSSTDEASPAVEAITGFAKLRGLSLTNPMVDDWRDSLGGSAISAAPVQAGAQPSSEEDSTELAFEAWWQRHGQFCRAGGGDYEKTFAFRAWEASLAIPVQAQERKPLSIERIKSMDYRGTLDVHIRAVRMTESAHDIKEQP